jgi:hypothetical protein
MARLGARLEALEALRGKLEEELFEVVPYLESAGCKG